MSDEATDLRRKLDEIERKTAIWRSQMTVLLLTFVAGWIASAVWANARIARVEANALRASKIVEAQAFVLKTEDGKEIASLRKTGNSARLSLTGDRNIFESTLSDDGLVISDTRPDANSRLSQPPPKGFRPILASVEVDKEGNLSVYDEKVHTHTLSDLLRDDRKR